MSADLPAVALAVRNLYRLRRGRRRRRGWVIDRIVYFLGYREAVPKRTPGFAIQAPADRVVDRCVRGGLWRLVH